jgi:hypothetical protein
MGPVVGWEMMRDHTHKVLRSLLLWWFYIAGLAMLTTLALPSMGFADYWGNRLINLAVVALCLGWPVAVAVCFTAFVCTHWGDRTVECPVTKTDGVDNRQ